VNRAVGKQYEGNEFALIGLDRFLQLQAVTSVQAITPDMIQCWISTMSCGSIRRIQQVRMARRFFDHLVAQGTLPRNPTGRGVINDERMPQIQFRPFIFSKEQVADLLAAAKRLPQNHLFPLRPQVAHTVIAVLYTLGLRVREACWLRLRDLDLDRGTFFIHQTKFHKSRLVPFGPRLAGCLRQYVDLRHTVLQPLREEDPLFVALWRRPLKPSTVRGFFRAALATAGLLGQQGGRCPRVHDLRHSFAVHRLLRWYREGVDVQTRLAHLATFMGHVDCCSTEVYLTVTSELLKEANSRFCRGFGSAVSGEEELS
jgi:site-specific recombinase XerD